MGMLNLTGISRAQQNEKQHDMRATLNRQKEAFLQSPYPLAEERLAQLTRLKSAIIKFQEPLITALNTDFGCRSRDDSLMGDIIPSVSAIHYATKRIKKWMKPQKRQVNTLFLPARAKVIYQPLGVVGIIVPWNYPLFLAIGPLVTALAAGNRAMIKLSEFTPNTNQVFKELIASCFSDTEVAIIEGESGIAAQFSALPFDHLLFTGSTQVGKHVMRAASDNLTPVTLELGGKSPALIAPDMPVKTAVKRLLWGKTLNAGQTCVSPDYILCHEDSLEALIIEAKTQFGRMYPKLSTNPDYTSVINNRQYARLTNALQEVVQQDIRIESLADEGSPSPTDSRKLPLTLIINPPEDSQLMTEEIFGPLFPVVTYKTIDEAIAFINRRPRPLALYLYSFDKALQHEVSYHTHSGALAFNDAVMHVAQDDLPFGGIGESGMGHYHGKEGFLTLSKTKSILSQGRLFMGGSFHPPYGTLAHKLVYKLFIR